MRFWKPRFPWNDDNFSIDESERLRALPVVIMDPDSGQTLQGFNTKTGMPTIRQEGQTPLVEFVKGEAKLARFKNGKHETINVAAFVFDTKDPDLIDLLTKMGYLREDDGTRQSDNKPVESMTILELRLLAKAKGIPGYGGMNKASLLEKLSNEPSEAS